MLFAVVGLSIVAVVLFGLFVFLYYHVKERDEWMRSWVAEFYQKHNNLYKLVKELEERIDAWEKMVGLDTLDAHGDVFVGRLQYSPDNTRTVATRRAAGTRSNRYSTSDAAANDGTIDADAVTALTYPYTLRECCEDNRPDDCPSWSVIGSLCIDVWAADTVR